MKGQQTPWPMTQREWHQFARSIRQEAAAAAADAAREARRFDYDEPLSAEEEETLF